jgi:hypothetical protein
VTRGSLCINFGCAFVLSARSRAEAVGGGGQWRCGVWRQSLGAEWEGGETAKTHVTKKTPFYILAGESGPVPRVKLSGLLVWELKLQFQFPGQNVLRNMVP